MMIAEKYTLCQRKENKVYCKQLLIAELLNCSIVMRLPRSFHSFAMTENKLLNC